MRNPIIIEVNYDSVSVAGTNVPRPANVSASVWMGYWERINKAMEANVNELDRFIRYGASQEESEEED